MVKEVAHRKNVGARTRCVPKSELVAGQEGTVSRSPISPRMRMASDGSTGWMFPGLWRRWSSHKGMYPYLINDNRTVDGA